MKPLYLIIPLLLLCSLLTGCSSQKTEEYQLNDMNHEIITKITVPKGFTYQDEDTNSLIHLSDKKENGLIIQPYVSIELEQYLIGNLDDYISGFYDSYKVTELETVNTSYGKFAVFQKVYAYIDDSETLYTEYEAISEDLKVSIHFGKHFYDNYQMKDLIPQLFETDKF